MSARARRATVSRAVVISEPSKEIGEDRRILFAEATMARHCWMVDVKGLENRCLRSEVVGHGAPSKEGAGTIAEAHLEHL